MNILIALALNSLALYITSRIIPGFDISDPSVAIVSALVLGILNTFIRPVLILLTAPINLLTLGLFSFVINAVVIYLAALLVPGFDVDGAIPAIAGAIVLALTSAVLSVLVKEVKGGAQKVSKKGHK